MGFWSLCHTKTCLSLLECSGEKEGEKKAEEKEENKGRREKGGRSTQRGQNTELEIMINRCNHTDRHRTRKTVT